MHRFDNRPTADFTYKFYINTVRILKQFYFHVQNYHAVGYLLTADIDTFIRPFVHCALLLAMVTPERKHLQRND